MILQVITQKRDKVDVRDFKVVPDEEKFNIVGIDASSHEQIILGVYTNGIFAQQVFGAMRNQLRTQFKGGPCYNIYEMPYDEVNYTYF